MAFQVAHQLVPRQAGIYSGGYGGCTSFDYTAVENCYYSGVYSALPSCYNYYTDSNCCSTWLSWEESYFSCLQTAYSNCFDFTSYVSSVSDFLPCYTNAPFAAPQSVNAQTTASPVPALILETISTGPPTVPTTHSPISTYSGQGSLLQGYCATPDYVLLDGPTALWAPALGCVGDKSDCCPYAVQGGTAVSTTVITVVSTVTVDVGPGGSTQGDYAGVAAYPTPASSNQATLAHCPGDYVSISGGCCPSGFKLWNAPLGGQIPCYSSLDSTLVPPAVPVTDYSQQIPVTGNVTAAASSSTPNPNQKPTSAVVNIVYAIQFPVQPSSGLSTGAKAGIGVGASLGGVAIVILSLLLVWRTRKHKKDKQTLSAMQQTPGPTANDQNQIQNGTSEATSPYAYSQRTELQTDGAAQMAQTPGGFVPHEQNGYFQQHQMQPPPQYYGQQPGQPMQQDLAPQGYYPQQPGQQMQQGYGQQPAQQMHGQSPVQYPSPVASSVSPQPTGSDGYGHQTGYAGAVPSSTGSPAPQEGYGHQFGYAAPVTELSPNSTGYGAPQSATHISPNTTGSQAPGEGYGYQGGYNPPEIGPHHPQPQELTAQTGYAAPVNELHHPQAQELNAQNPPGEMHG